MSGLVDLFAGLAMNAVRSRLTMDPMQRRTIQNAADVFGQIEAQRPRAPMDERTNTQRPGPFSWGG
jgi:hypothetical protein